MTTPKPIKFGRLFVLARDTDVSGVSGTGPVAEGVVFSDGHAAIHWLGRYPTTTPHPDGLASVKAVHGHGGATRIVFADDPTDRLARIAAAHTQGQEGGGVTSGYCVDCDQRWPCPTYVWASTDRDPLATWDPADDEPQPCTGGLLPLDDGPADPCTVVGQHERHRNASGETWTDGEAQP